MDVNELLSTVENKTKKPPKSHSSKNDDKSFDNVMDSISSNWEKQSSTDEIQKLKNELKKAKVKIQALESSTEGLTKNEEKIISAIQSESLKQNTHKPIISYNKFRKAYKVSSDYYRPSVNSLIEKGIVSKEEATYSGEVKTYRWQIITRKSLSGE